MAGRALLPEVGERAGGKLSGEARIVGLLFAVVAAPDENAARGVERAGADVFALGAIVTRVLF